MPDSQQRPQRFITTDASCLGNPGMLEYRALWGDTREVIFQRGPFKNGTNNIGEYLALVLAIIWCQKNGHHNTPIYTDSITAMAWVRKKKIGTKLTRTAQNAQLFDAMAIAQDWLLTHEYHNPILKWDTDNWGEIPADYGRK